MLALGKPGGQCPRYNPGAMFSRFSSAPAPCLCCNKEEHGLLHDSFEQSDQKFWVYTVKVPTSCNRCRSSISMETYAKAVSAVGVASSVVMATHSHFNSAAATICASAGLPMAAKCIDWEHKKVQVPLPSSVVGMVERAMHSASVAKAGSDFRAHGTFIALLATLDCEEEYKQALCCWAPLAMKSFLEGDRGVSRVLRSGRRQAVLDTPIGVGETLDVESSTTSGPGALPSATINTDALQALSLPPANPGTEDGMVGTQVAADAYGEEKRATGVTYGQEAKVLAHQIGPDLIPTEVMDSCASNLKAGLAKRVQPLPFKPEKNMIRKINKTVDMLLKRVFSVDRIKQWRVENPVVEEFCSSKWSPERFRNAYEEAMSETVAKIEQTFQIKQNEALPAKDKAPRPIIQCGDKAQVMMSLPVKCFEELLFEFFEQSSIKHVSKYDAMRRVANHLKQEKAHLIEGDGSAWDACCNWKIRSMTENRILKHVIAVLGGDPEVPNSWMEAVITDMEKKKLKGKAKISDFQVTPLRVCIESIRQSGHRGTSCFNYLINLVCWLCVLCANPHTMICKLRDGKLQSKYVSAFDGKEYYLKYAFEGDDSAISTTENINQYTRQIEEIWTSLGFRMKLVFVDKKMTFTGFDFLCDENGPTGDFVPEVARNISSSSWTTSSLVKSFPHRASEVGAAAMLARAENFKDCGPFCAYFAAIGLAHVRKSGDRGLEFAEAKSLALDVSPSIKNSLQELYDSAGVMTPAVRSILRYSGIKLSPEEELAMLRADFGDDPHDLQLARMLIPHRIWDPSNFAVPRR